MAKYLVLNGQSWRIPDNYELDRVENQIEGTLNGSVPWTHIQVVAKGAESSVALHIRGDSIGSYALYEVPEQDKTLHAFT